MSAAKSPAVDLSAVEPSAGEPKTLDALRRVIAGASRPGGETRLDVCVRLGVASLDQALGGGLVGGALHEIGPAAPREPGRPAGAAAARRIMGDGGSAAVPRGGRGRDRAHGRRRRPHGDAAAGARCRHRRRSRPDPAPPALPGGECGDDALGGRVRLRRARRFRRPCASHLRGCARQESPWAHRPVALVMGSS
jgi:hypothetical protein